ncbi:DUF4349 domain-containing protein [Aeoliella mucimassa]|uniref:DUF4349 domain-containing protein n=1 Tax=Aeoliella mucimassa TaxID=2527972 RepID=UPI0018D31FAE|nr:DUF4349 domain-containing protein [Aeoliella mucimassa]
MSRSPASLASAESYSQVPMDDTASDADSPNEATSAAENRKLIYTATVDIVVDNFDQMESAVSVLVKKHGGFIASSNVNLNQGDRRSGTWVVRIPVASFESFLQSTGDMGVPENLKRDTQDVTEEYVDLEARIRSKQKLEQRVLELLDSNKGEIKDVIEVERELSRVRTEIEQMEGRLRYLTDRAELTTVTLSIREEKNYTPPQAPKFGTELANTFQDSANGLLTFGKNLLLVLTACAPWLVVVLVVVAPWWVWRRRRKQAGSVS